MRRTIYQSARRAAGAFESETPLLRRAPYICSECRQHTPLTRSRLSKPFLASFSTSARQHQNQTSTTSQQQQPTSDPASRNHYTLFPQTFPQGPPPSAPFTPDLRQLRKEYLQLQANAHPDLAGPAQKRQAEGLSSWINEAYKTLQDPLRRAQYLLSLQGIDVEDESAKLEDNALLMEVMEAREAVEEVEDEEGLVAIRAENTARVESTVGQLEGAFEQSDFERAAREAVRLRYWANIEESIQGWEKGKGGGINHH